MRTVNEVLLNPVSTCLPPERTAEAGRGNTVVYNLVLGWLKDVKRSGESKFFRVFWSSVFS